MKQIKLKCSYEAPTMESVEIHAENCIMGGGSPIQSSSQQVETMDWDDDELGW